MPPTIPGSSCSRNWNRVATPKLPPPPRIAQNRSGCVLRVDAQHLAVRGDDLGREQVVDRQAVLADQVADAAAERDARRCPTEPGVAEADREAVLGGRGRDLGRGEARLRPRRSAPSTSMSSAGQVAQVEDDPAVGRAVAGAAVAAAPDGELQPGLRATAMTVATSAASATRTIDGGPRVDAAEHDRRAPRRSRASSGAMTRPDGCALAELESGRGLVVGLMRSLVGASDRWSMARFGVSAMQTGRRPGIHRSGGATRASSPMDR